MKWQKKGNETCQSGKQYKNCNIYEKVTRNKFSGHNKNIKEQINNENAVKSKQSQFSHGIVKDTFVNKDCDNNIDKYVKDKTIKNNGMGLEKNDNTVKNNDVVLEKNAPKMTDLHDDQLVRISSRHSKSVIRLNNEGRGVHANKIIMVSNHR